MKSPISSGPLIRFSFRKHLDGLWSWQVYVFAPRDRSGDDKLPRCVYIREPARFVIDCGTVRFRTERKAAIDMKAALQIVGLDKAQTT